LGGSCVKFNGGMADFGVSGARSGSAVALLCDVCVSLWAHWMKTSGYEPLQWQKVKD